MIATISPWRAHHESRSRFLAHQRAHARAGGLLIPAAGRRRGDHNVLRARRQAESLCAPGLLRARLPAGQQAVEQVAPRALRL
jgi:hypothetical protein